MMALTRCTKFMQVWPKVTVTVINTNNSVLQSGGKAKSGLLLGLMARLI